MGAGTTRRGLTAAIDTWRGGDGVALAAAFAFFVAVSLSNTFAPITAVDRFGAGGLGVGIAVAAFGAPGFFVRPFAGRAVDRRGPIAGLALGCVLGLSAFLGLAVAPVLAVFVVFRVWSGVADAYVLPAASAVSDDGRGEPGAAYTRFAVVLTAGTALAPLLAALLSGIVGPESVWWAALVCCVLGWLLARARRRAHGPPGSIRPAPPAPVRREWLRRGSLAPGLFFGLSNIGFVTVFGFAALLARDRGLGSPTLVVAAFSVPMVAGRVFLPHLPDRLGVARTVTLGTWVIAAGLLVGGALPGVPALVAGLFVAGTGFAFVMPALLAEATRAAPESERGAVVGTMTGLFDLCATVGSIALGAVAAGFGYAAPFLVGALVTAGSLLVVRYWRTRR